MQRCFQFSYRITLRHAWLCTYSTYIQAFIFFSFLITHYDRYHLPNARRPDRYCEFCHNRFIDCNNVCPAVAAAAATVLCKEKKNNNALIRTNTTTCAVLLQCSATGDTSSALLSSRLQGKSVIVKNRYVSHLYTLRLVMRARTIIIRSP